jgi:putative ABC transport system permease protein
MFRNYFSVAWRNILRGKYYSLLNIGGLAIGICFTLLIGGFVLHEVFVNKHLKNVDRQYILLSHWKKDNQGQTITSFGPLAKELKERYPGLVADYYRFDGISAIVSRGATTFREDIQMGDSSLLNMYGFQLIHGNGNHALDEPYTVVLFEDLARKYFGKTDVVGQVLSIENFAGVKHDFSITAVLGRTAEYGLDEPLDCKLCRVEARCFTGRPFGSPESTYR